MMSSRLARSEESSDASSTVLTSFHGENPVLGMESFDLGHDW